MKIDIIVPTYNRPDDIKKFVTEIQKQTFTDFKVYIIDDCGDIEVDHLIPKGDDRFIFERLAKNGGQTVARNIAISKGNGEIIVSLDDDAWFLNESALEIVADKFQSNSSLGCLMFDINEPNSDFISNRLGLKDNTELSNHITCGCAYSRKAFGNDIRFNEVLHSGAEETDISLKLIRKGYKIYFTDKVKVFHNYLPGNRTKQWYLNLRYNITRNDMLIVLLFFPTVKIIPYLFGKYFSHIKFSITNKKHPFSATIYTLFSFFGFLSRLKYSLVNRRALTIEQFEYWKNNRYW